MPKPSRLEVILKRVHDTHARVKATESGTPGTAQQGVKSKLERPAVAEKVRDHFRKKFIADPQRDALCDAIFGCKVWPTEELLLEDLIRAKHEGDTHQIDHLRDLVHANSWSSHTAPLSHDVLIGRAYRMKDAIATQQRSVERIDPEEGHNFDEQLHECEVILDALQTHIDGERAEAATRAIERWMDQAWHDLTIIKRTMPFSWETEKVLRRTRPHLRAILKRIEALREIRDQVYYQRLYPHLFREGKEPPHHTS